MPRTDSKGWSALSRLHKRVKLELKSCWEVKRITVKTSLKKLSYLLFGLRQAKWWQKLRDWGGASSLRPSGSLTQTQSHKHLQDCYWKTYIFSSPAFLCTYPEQPVCTSLLFIFLFIKSQYTVFCTSSCFAHLIVLHFLLLFLFFTIYMLLCCVTFI